MSESSNFSPKPNLEFMRKEAKALLKQCRAGDAQAIRRMRAQLPRLAALNDAQVADEIRLADVQHAIAREQGQENWGYLKREDSVIEQFLAAIRGGALKEAQRVFALLPEMASESIHAACALGDPEVMTNHLNLNPNLLSEEHAGWSPLFYVCASPLYRAKIGRAHV